MPAGRPRAPRSAWVFAPLSSADPVPERHDCAAESITAVASVLIGDQLGAEPRLAAELVRVERISGYRQPPPAPGAGGIGRCDWRGRHGRCAAGGRPGGGGRAGRGG
jgi:hypothetical protein